VFKRQTLDQNRLLMTGAPARFAKNGLGLLVAALLIPQTSFAGPPIAFGSTACPSGFSCEVNVQSTGMTQRILTDGAGTSYFQVTIQEGQANNGGSFFYDSFVNGSNNNTQGGISALLDINQTGDHNLNYSTTLNLGWANSSGSAAIDISQAITDNYQGVGMDYSFSYQQRQNNNGGATGFFYAIDQTLTGSGRLNGSSNGGEDIHTFALRRAAGDYVSAGSNTLAGTGGGGGMDGGGGGGGGGGGMRKASIGSSTGSTTTFQSAFVADPNGYGTDGTIAVANGDPLTGDAQTEPAAGTIYGPEAYVPPQFTNGFSDNPNISESNGDTNTMNYVATNNTGYSSGNIDSDANASGPAAPTSQINVPTGSTMGMGDSGGPSGGTVSWNTGDEVQAIWIGQSCPSCATSGGMMGGGSAGVFSFHQYENLSTGSSAATRSYTRSTPFDWTTNPFGAAPSL